MANAKAKGQGGQNTAAVVEALVRPVLEGMGLRLWDVRFEKEGPDWYLRILIDRDTPVDLAACEAASRAVDPLLDEADLIASSYILDVGSPGLGRRLVRDGHFEAMRGRKITAHLIRPDAAGERDITGELVSKEGPLVTIRTPEGPRAVSEKQAAWFKLCDDEDL